jgi:hypothetical protein
VRQCHIPEKQRPQLKYLISEEQSLLEKAEEKGF